MSGKKQKPKGQQDRMKLLEFTPKPQQDVTATGLMSATVKMRLVHPIAQNILFSYVRGKASLDVSDEELDKILDLSERFHEKATDKLDVWAKAFDAPLQEQVSKSGLILPGMSVSQDHILGAMQQPDRER